MASQRKSFLVAVFTLFIFYSSTGFSKSIVFTDGSIRLNGDSTIRKFSAVSSKLTLSGSANPSVAATQAMSWSPVAVDIRLDVKSLKSDSSTLDDHMYESLKADKYPQILVNLNKFRFENNLVFASGSLTIAGVTKPLELKAAFEVSDNKLVFKGTQVLQMTDYGVEPPTMMMGTIRTADKIEIVFNVNCLTTTQEEKK